MDASSFAERYIAALDPERARAVSALRKAILDHLPPGFAEEENYGMIGYVVPKSIYPAGYGPDPSKPLPFMALASQKRFISFYHMGIYAMPELSAWFGAAYRAATGREPDMGKSCLRFSDPEAIPFSLIGELAGKVSAEDWIRVYESSRPQGRASSRASGGTL